MSTEAASALPPHVQLIQMGTAYWGSQLLLAAAQLDLADRLAGGARSASDLAHELALHPPSLHRFMRSLAGMGLLTEVQPKTFALTSLGEALKKDAPGSARATILVLTGVAGQLWTNLSYSLKTGRPATDEVFGKPLFDYIGERPELVSLFSETMVGFHGREPAAVAAAYDFDTFGSVVDVGGATGNMLVHILQRHKEPRGVLFDMPHVVDDAVALLAAHGMTDRVAIEPGSFFEAVPQGHDAYVLSHIIHDWNEDQCQTILANCRRAIASKGRLLIVEMVLPEGDAPHHGKMLDMMMLVGPGGQERTGEEYRALLKKANFRMTRVVPTASDVSIVEAVPS
jgi:O-methyltransferase/methyltransferase family protein